MRDIETIRFINKNSSKELAVYVDDRMGKVPIFGYPLLCYSPNEIDQSGTLFKVKNIQYDPN